MAEKNKLYEVEFISMFDRDTRRVSKGSFYSTPKDFEKTFKGHYLNAELISVDEKQKGTNNFDKPKSKKAVKRNGNNDNDGLFARDNV